MEKHGDDFEDIKWNSNDAKEEKFWVTVKRKITDEDDKERFGQIVEAGEILCSLRIYPMDLAEKFDQGSGRDAPNNDPFCPEPEGRIKLSLNPFEMFN